MTPVDSLQKAAPPPPVQTFETKGTQRFSKYIADERNTPTSKNGFATVESVVDADAWNEEYIKVSLPPCSHDDSLISLPSSQTPETSSRLVAPTPPQRAYSLPFIQNASTL